MRRATRRERAIARDNSAKCRVSAVRGKRRGPNNTESRRRETTALAVGDIRRFRKRIGANDPHPRADSHP